MCKVINQVYNMLINMNGVAPSQHSTMEISTKFGSLWPQICNTNNPHLLIKSVKWFWFKQKLACSEYILNISTKPTPPYSPWSPPLNEPCTNRFIATIMVLKSSSLKHLITGDKGGETWNICNTQHIFLLEWHNLTSYTCIFWMSN